MICPIHDTHIDICVHENHADIHDSWEIRIPMRTSCENILLLAMKIENILTTEFNRNTPVNISLQGEYDHRLPKHPFE